MEVPPADIFTLPPVDFLSAHYKELLFLSIFYFQVRITGGTILRKQP